MSFSVFFLLLLFAVVWVVSVPEEKSREEALAQLPLVQADYREITGDPVSADYQYTESILGSRLRGMVEYGENGSEDNEGETDRLTYEVYRSTHPWILDEVWRRETDSQALPLGEENVWDALDARYVGEMQGTGILYVRWGDAVLVLSADAMPDEGQMRVIKERLAL